MKNSINGIECKDKNTGKIVTAYHIEENGAAHNKENNVLRLCVCLPLAQSFNLRQMLMGQIAQNRCYKLAADY